MKNQALLFVLLLASLTAIPVIDCFADKSAVLVLGENKAEVEATAAADLSAFLKSECKFDSVTVVSAKDFKQGDTKKEEIVFILGTPKSNSLLAGRGGELKVKEIPEDKDGFIIKAQGREIVISSPVPRGVLYGVYELEDMLQERPALINNLDSLDVVKIPFFDMRVVYPRNCFYIHSPEGGLGCYNTNHLRYVSRMRFNTITPNSNVFGTPCPGKFHHFVISDVYPQLSTPEIETFLYTSAKGCKYNTVDKVKAKMEEIHKWSDGLGMDEYFYLSEPVNISPKEAESVFEKDTLGVNKHLGFRAQCISHPKIQAHFSNMVAKLVTEYPWMKGVMFCSNDSGAGVCDHNCPRCHAEDWQNFAKYVQTLQQGTGNSKFKIIVDGHSWDFRYGDLLPLLFKQPHNLGLMLKDSSGKVGEIDPRGKIDTTIVVMDLSEQFKQGYKLSKESNIPFIAETDLTGHEQYMFLEGFPNPIPVYLKLNRLAREGVTNFKEFWGIEPAVLCVNDLVIKEMVYDPFQDRDKLLTKIANLQFGKEAGKKMMQAWEQGYQVAKTWGEHSHGWIEGWHPFVNDPSAYGKSLYYQAITPSNVFTRLYTVNKPLAFNKFYHPGFRKGYIPYLREMIKHSQKMEDYAKEAVDLAPENEKVTLVYDRSREGLSKKAYAQEQFDRIKIAKSVHKSMYNLFYGDELMSEIKEAVANADTKKVEGKKNEFIKLMQDEIDNLNEIIEPAKRTRTDFNFAWINDKKNEMAKAMPLVDEWVRGLKSEEGKGALIFDDFEDGIGKWETIIQGGGERIALKQADDTFIGKQAMAVHVPARETGFVELVFDFPQPCPLTTENCDGLAFYIKARDEKSAKQQVWVRLPAYDWGKRWNAYFKVGDTNWHKVVLNFDDFKDRKDQPAPLTKEDFYSLSQIDFIFGGKVPETDFTIDCLHGWKKGERDEEIRKNAEK